ncbi:MAG: metalloregulator ArsR/SmtB family transcription factor [Chromatiales bacterium]|nr:metalloregulator ArsR/SmtB family transcription factor [Chromatiales bacterium]
MPDQLLEQRLDQIFMALADATRRELVRMLALRSHTMNELAAPFDMSLAAVSKHVKVLEKAGLVGRRIEGRVHHLSLVATPLAQALDWISIYRRFWQNKLDDLEQILKEDG